LGIIVATVADLLSANLHRVFGNRDESSRQAAIRDVYAEDVEFSDPEEVVTGWAALGAKARDLLGRVPDTYVFAEDSPKYVGPDFGALAWAFGPAGAPVVRGIDVITVRDGRITTVRTVFVEGQPTPG
jgi:hypothetical protein